MLIYGDFWWNSIFSQIKASYSQKICSEFIFKHFLLKAFIDLMKNNFFWKFPKNEQFSLNQVQKMTNKIIFSIKPKMFTVYDFHMDFQFWSKKVLPRNFQMGLTLPWLWEGCDWCGMDPKSLKMDFRDLYRSGHVWLSVVLIYPNLSAFWTHPNAQHSFSRVWWCK